MPTTTSTEKIAMHSSKTGQIEENVHSVNMAIGISEERRLHKKRLLGYHIKRKLLIDLVANFAANMTLI